jgi:hypothetical protein
VESRDGRREQREQREGTKGTNESFQSENNQQQANTSEQRRDLVSFFESALPTCIRSYQ